MLCTFGHFFDKYYLNHFWLSYLMKSKKELSERARKYKLPVLGRQGMPQLHKISRDILHYLLC